MPVQKSRVTRSKRGMRRSHDGLTAATVAFDVATGESHRRHHISPKGFYKGKRIIDKSVKVQDENDNVEE